MTKKLSKMMIFGPLILLQILLNLAVAQDSKEAPVVEEVSLEYYNKYIYEPRISGRYIRGNFLIYDCRSKHFACVNKDSHKDCTKENKCLQIQEHKTQKECFEGHTKLQEKTKIFTYCDAI